MSSNDPNESSDADGDGVGVGDNADQCDDEVPVTDADGDGCEDGSSTPPTIIKVLPVSTLPETGSSQTLAGIAFWMVCLGGMALIVARRNPASN